VFIPTVVLAFVASFVVAGFTSGKPDDRLPDLIKLIGLDTSFNQFGANLKVGIKRAAAGGKNGGDIAQKVLIAADSAIDVAFKPDALQREFQRAMSGRLENADLDAIFAFYKAPLGVRMTALENAKLKEAPDAAMKKAAELDELIKQEPERAEVLKELESSLKLNETATDQAFNLARAITIGMVAADEKTKTLPTEAIEVIDSRLEKMRPALAAQIKQLSALSLTYTYREASISELRQYVRFLKSPAGRKLYGTAVPALNEVFIKAGAEFGHALMRELGKERA
jgi:hypothetical protein